MNDFLRTLAKLLILSTGLATILMGFAILIHECDARDEQREDVRANGLFARSQQNVFIDAAHLAEARRLGSMVRGYSSYSSCGGNICIIENLAYVCNFTHLDPVCVPMATSWPSDQRIDEHTAYLIESPNQ